MSSKTLPITVIIVTYNSNKHIFKCIENISKSTQTPKEIIIFDNNSNISPFKEIKKLNNKKIKIQTIQNKSNIGFAKAVNKASKQSKTDYLLLLNPDFYINKKAIESIWKTMNLKMSTAVVGGKAIGQNNNILKTIANKPSFMTLFIEFTSLKKIFELFNIENASNFWDCKALRSKKPVQVDAVSGCFMLIKKKWFDEIGKFDPKFKLYLEDLDLCLRIGNKNGNIYFDPLSYGYHIEGGSSVDKPNKINQAFWDKSKRYFSKKYFGTLGRLLIVVYFLDDILLKIKKSVLK